MTNNHSVQCCTCTFHTGCFENCGCQMCLPEFHQHRCVEDKRGHCCFYKEKEK